MDIHKIIHIWEREWRVRGIHFLSHESESWNQRFSYWHHSVIAFSSPIPFHSGSSHPNSWTPFLKVGQLFSLFFFFSLSFFKKFSSRISKWVGKIFYFSFGGWNIYFIPISTLRIPVRSGPRKSQQVLQDIFTVSIISSKWWPSVKLLELINNSQDSTWMFPHTHLIWVLHS